MDAYLHIRVVISLLVGLGIAHLLRGTAGMIEHPRKAKACWIHLIWVLFMFLYMLHFWWWEFRLEKVSTWTFPLYLFLNFYGVLLYLLCSILFPEDMDDYEGFESYFYSRRRWFFGLLALMFIVDIWDTLIKGNTYLHTLGLEYELRLCGFIICAFVAMKTKNKVFHGAFAIIGTLYEISYILRLYFIQG